MANVSPWLANALLDWSVGGSNPTRPAAHFVGFSLDLPSATSFNEVGAGSGYARQSAVFAPATSARAVNAATMAFGPFSSAVTLSGLIVCDAASGGQLLWFGTIAPARTILAGDAPVLAVGAVEVSISLGDRISMLTDSKSPKGQLETSRRKKNVMMHQRRVRYFDANGVEVSEQIATRNGVLRDRFSLRVPTVFRDSRLTDARQLWDSGGLVVTDANSTGVSGSRPGWRVLDTADGQAEKARAYADYDRDRKSAHRDAATAGAYSATGEGERGARGSQEGDLCTCRGPYDEGPQGAAGHLVRRDGDLVCRADDEEQYSEADSMTVDAMNATHVRNMQRIYDQIAVDLSRQWRRDK